MLNNRTVIVKDACVIIDLVDLKIIDKFLHSFQSVFVPEAVINEITDANQRSVVDRCITSGHFVVDNNASLDQIVDLLAANQRLSFADCSVIELAKRKKGSILSSDAGLRVTARKVGLSVGGIIWVIKVLCNRAVLSNQDAIGILKMYDQINIRAPKKEIAILMSQLEAEINVIKV